jgi:hypothetical protein
MFMDLPVEEGHHNCKRDNRKSCRYLGTCHDVFNIEIIHFVIIALIRKQHTNRVYRMQNCLSTTTGLGKVKARRSIRPKD